EHGARAEPRLKPGWSPERLLAYPYTGRLAVFRRTTLADAGGIRLELALALDHDVALRVGERARRVAHIAEVLYHRRPPYPGSPTAPARAHPAARRPPARHRPGRRRRSCAPSPSTSTASGSPRPSSTPPNARVSCASTPRARPVRRCRS